MAGPVIRDPFANLPQWAQDARAWIDRPTPPNWWSTPQERPGPEMLEQIIRALIRATGVTDPQSQVLGVMAPLQAPAGRTLTGGFYSRVDEAARQIPDKGAHPSKVLSTLRNNASQEELAYRKVPEFVANKGQALITKAELEAHLKAHPAPFPNVTTRGGGPKAFRTVPTMMLPDEAVAAYPRGQVPPFAVLNSDDAPISFHQTIQSAREAIAELPQLGIHGAGPATKYAQYQVPGGKNYRETLLSLPAERYWVNGERIAAEDLATQAGREAADRVGSYGDEVFQSGHFDQPNVLVHTRANERTLPTGERGRFVEEVQSDWHQAGKQRGYRPSTPPTQRPLRATQRDGYWEVTTDQGGFVTNVYGSDAATPEAAIAEAQRRVSREPMRTATDTRVPDAPFKESWPDLGIKQQLIEAANDPDAQWLGFTGGKTQADRYDLSKQVSQVLYDENSRTLVAFDNPGRLRPARMVIEKSGVTPDQLDQYIGKEAAQKLLATPVDEEGARVLSGLDLQVGGKGMHAFYDELLPARTGKILKPFGGTVERGPVNYVPSVTKSQMPIPGAGIQAHDDAWIARLTPEMKERIRREGLPLMSVVAALAEASRRQSEPRMMGSH